MGSQGRLVATLFFPCTLAFSTHEYYKLTNLQTHKLTKFTNFTNSQTYKLTKIQTSQTYKLTNSQTYKLCKLFPFPTPSEKNTYMQSL